MLLHFCVNNTEWMSIYLLLHTSNGEEWILILNKFHLFHKTVLYLATDHKKFDLFYHSQQHPWEIYTEKGIICIQLKLKKKKIGFLLAGALSLWKNGCLHTWGSRENSSTWGLGIETINSLQGSGKNPMECRRVWISLLSGLRCCNLCLCDSTLTWQIYLCSCSWISGFHSDFGPITPADVRMTLNNFVRYCRPDSLSILWKIIINEWN